MSDADENRGDLSEHGGKAGIEEFSDREEVDNGEDSMHFCGMARELAQVEHHEELLTGAWEDLWLDVLHIRFSQEQIHPFFHQRGPIQDVLPEIENEPCSPGDTEYLGSAAAPAVRLLPPFEPIRCIRHHGDPPLHDDWITLDNRRLYALQLTAVERWPAQSLVRVKANGEIAPESMKTEVHKLEKGGHGPLGKHDGKPPALMKHLCGDIEVLVASRGSAWEPWYPMAAVLERCGGVRADGGVAPARKAEAKAAPDVTDKDRQACEAALCSAREAMSRERWARAAVSDPATIAAHAKSTAELRSTMEALRNAAAAASGVLVRRVGTPGDRDGYISVSAQAEALRRIGGVDEA